MRFKGICVIERKKIYVNFIIYNMYYVKFIKFIRYDGIDWFIIKNFIGLDRRDKN